LDGHLEIDAAGLKSLAQARDDTMERERRQQLERDYEKLWNDYGASLSRLASSYEFLPQAREDLLQEIRLALWTALPNFRGDCSLRTFVYRIAHNRALTHVWRRKAHPLDEEEPPDVVDPKSNPERSAIQNANQSKLMAAVRSLPVPYRQVITMTLEELPQVEIAAVLGISENNVAVRLNRARKLLRDKLGGVR
jgi:RNA polymerase sigma-70 factor (ECF subfamily)